MSRLNTFANAIGHPPSYAKLLMMSSSISFIRISRSRCSPSSQRPSFSKPIRAVL